MLAQALDIVDLEARVLHGGKRVSDVGELGAGEDVLLEQTLLWRDPPTPATRRLGAARDAVIEKDPAIAEQAVQCAEVAREVAQPDVFEHADARNLVVLAVETCVIDEVHADAILEPESPNLFARELALLRRQRHAVGVDSVLLRRVADQPTPAAADVQETLAGLETKLPTDHLHLVELGLLEAVLPVGEVGAGVLHLPIEKERVELVRDVVVELDEVAVVPPGFPAAGRLTPEPVFELLRAVPCEDQR